MADEALHILLVPMGTPGDAQAFVDLGVELQSRGHRATVVASAYFREWAVKAGLGFQPTVPIEQYQRMLDDKNLWHLRKAHRVFAKKLVLPSIRPVYKAIEEAKGRGERIVVVAQTMALGARIARDKMEFPLVTVHRQPSPLRSAYKGAKIPFLWQPWWFARPVKRLQFWGLDKVIDHSFAPAVNKLRGELGLGEVYRIADRWLHSPDAVVGLWPEWFAPKQPDWPGNVHLVGFNIQERGEEEPSKELQEFLGSGERGEAPIVFTVGSGMRHGEWFYHASVEVCRLLKRRGVMVTRYREQLPDELPSGVMHASYAPFNWLLPKCAAMVHHAGIGTVAQALVAEIPQLNVAGLVFDTIDTADRLNRAGVSATVMANRYNAGTAAKALEELLRKPEVKKRCEELGKEVREQDAIGGMAEIVEAMATRGR